MKYIDAEKLKAEIESRMEDCKLPDGRFPTTTNIVRHEELSCLRNFITSLQQEMPEVELEEEIDAYLQDWEDDEEIGVHLSTDFGDMPIEIDDIRDLARHFYNLGLNARKEE